jgi:chemotaxis protein methyltransferase CheR
LELPADSIGLGVPELRPREFALIREFVHCRLGIDLRSGKERLVSARLGKHVVAGGFASYESYLHHVQRDSSGKSLLSLIDAITTNHTGFLREPEHFRLLVSDLVTPLLRRRTLQIWSAASSTGEEVYSILFTLLDHAPLASQTVTVFGSDISTRALQTASEGRYAENRMDAVPPGWRQRYFDRLPSGCWNVKPQYRAMTVFRRVNLIEPFPQAARYPVIFCRNVMIYFDKATQTDLVRRLGSALEPGGFLFVGHAESLTGIQHDLRYVRPAVYQRVR